MKIYPDIHTVEEQDMVVAFFDLTGFLRFSHAHSAARVFRFLDAYYEFVGDIVAEAEGRVVKGHQPLYQCSAMYTSI